MLQNLESAGREHEEFTEWAISQGIEINGVAPVRFPGQGIGIAAKRKIDVDEIIVSVPIDSSVTIETIPASFKDKFQDEQISVQGLFAAFFCLCDEEEDSGEKYSLWKTVWPSMQDFKDSMPILWPSYLTGQEDPVIPAASSSNRDRNDSARLSLLPPSISGSWHSRSNEKLPGSPGYIADHQNILPGQVERLKTAFQIVQRVFPDAEWEPFVYAWLVVNTRCFYFVPKGAKRPEDPNDAIALCPFADYFNHSDNNGCEATFNEHRYMFKTTRSYEPGEEIFVSYGHHTSDTLLTEYGFVPKENQWDCIYLDDIVLNNMTNEQKEDLSLERYLGNYQVTSSGPCFRTEVAACITQLSDEDWNSYILGDPPLGFDQAEINRTISGWIRAYIDEANLVISKVKAERVAMEDDEPRVEVVISRWEQIVNMCHAALDAME